MSTTTKITAFGALLATLFAAAALAGAKLDPAVDTPAAGHADEGDEMGMGAHDASASTPGLAVADGGYRLELESTTLARGDRAEIALRIAGPDGQTVRDFDVEHTKRMHLIVVRRDFAHFQHLHPRQLADGTWRADANLSAAGVYRVFADFSTGGQPLTLAADVFAGGSFEPRPLPAPATRADAGDGYEVALDSDPGVEGGPAHLSFTVSRNGRQLDRIEPYLGADGHLVALRENDLAFLHTHPQGEAGGTGPIAFEVEYPRPGRYRLFLQFKDRGEVHTAAFTQEIGGAP